MMEHSSFITPKPQNPSMKRLKLKFKMKPFILFIALLISVAKSRLLANGAVTTTSSGQKCFYSSVDTYPTNTTKKLNSDQTIITSSPLYTPQHRISRIDYCWNNIAASNG